MLKSKPLIILLGLLFTFSLQSNSSAAQYEKSTLNVNGKGEIKAMPDVAYMNISVETTTKKAEDAVRENATKTSNVIKKLKSMIGSKDNVKTTNYHLSPMYEYDKVSRKNFINGYRVSNEVIVETYNLNNLGQLIDATTTLGANRINGPRFDISNREDYKKQALVKAVDDAKKTADIVAKSAGVSLVKIVQISPTYNFPIPIYQRQVMAKTVAAAESAPTPIEAGDLNVTANVSIVYEIQ